MVANLSDGTRNELIIDFQKRLKEAAVTRDGLENDLKLVNLKINDYKAMLTFLGVSFNEHDEILILDNNEIELDTHQRIGKNLTWSQKVIAILDNPAKYEFHLYKGIDDIFNAVAKEFFESTDKENAEKVKRTLAPTVSRLINDGEIVKVKKIGTKNEFYQISPRWFIEVGGIKKPLPEYEEILRDYEVVE